MRQQNQIYFGPKMPWGERAYLVNVEYSTETSGHEWALGKGVEIYSLEVYETDPTAEILEQLYNLDDIPDHFLDQIKEELCRN